MPSSRNESPRSRGAKKSRPPRGKASGYHAKTAKPRRRRDRLDPFDIAALRLGSGASPDLGTGQPCGLQQQKRSPLATARQPARARSLTIGAQSTTAPVDAPRLPPSGA